MTRKVFISSTSEALEAYRRAALEECIRLQMVPIVMELFEAMTRGATDGSQRKLDEADLYLGVFANRYGFIEPGRESSVTECEFDHASQRGIDRLCFLVQPGYETGEALEDELHRTRLEAFKRRIEGTLIRAHFTTVDDFRGKVRLALQEWLEGDLRAKSPQPILTSNVLEAESANRLTYRARGMSFLGRDRERSVLQRFLAVNGPVAWMVVAGAGGVGKSRLLQEFCLAVEPGWRAGFVPAKQSFDWSTWEPNADTLLVVDYAAERAEEIRAMMMAILGRPNFSARIRIVLLERDPDGPWIQQLKGARSEGYAMERVCFAESPLVLGGLGPQELWEAMRGVLNSGNSPWPGKEDVLNRLRAIDPDGLPLFAAFAADALAAGRDLGEWDRDRLFRDVLARERQRWAAAGVSAPYENLLALATAIGGDTEQVLESAAGSLRLPYFREFERSVYHVMAGGSPEGDDIPALKPDLLGEFFVLEQVKGRNARMTSLQAADLMAAAWKARGGAKSIHPFGVDAITYLSPSSLIHFLTRVVEDFPDHPSTAQLLARPQDSNIDLRYWTTLLAIAIRRHAIRGDLGRAKAFFEQLATLTPEALQAMDGAGGFIRAGLYLMPVLVKDAQPAEAREILGRIRAVLAVAGPDQGKFRDFCEAASESVLILIRQGNHGQSEDLIEALAQVVRDQPENQDLRLPFVKALAALVIAPTGLEERERAFERLLGFCQTVQDDITLYERLAAAALALCVAYAQEPSRLADAESKNRMIRGLARRRAEHRLGRFKEPFSPEVEWVEDDLREIRLHWIDSNAELVAPWTLAQRFDEASQLINEAMRLWRRFHRKDLAFALRWAGIVARHADARAKQGAVEQVPKAVEALQDAAAEFDNNPAFTCIASELTRAAASRAVQGGQMEAAAKALEALRQMAIREGAPAEVVANYADAAFSACQGYQAVKDWGSFLTTVRSAAGAIRSEAYQARLRTRGADNQAIAEILRWVDANEAAGARSPES